MPTEGEKSTTQKLTDSTSNFTSGDAKDTGKTYLETAQDTAASIVDTVSDKLKGTLLTPLNLFRLANIFLVTVVADKISESTSGK